MYALLVHSCHTLPNYIYFIKIQYLITVHEEDAFIKLFLPFMNHISVENKYKKKQQQTPYNFLANSALFLCNDLKNNGSTLLIVHHGSCCVFSLQLQVVIRVKVSSGVTISAFPLAISVTVFGIVYRVQMRRTVSRVSTLY